MAAERHLIEVEVIEGVAVAEILRARIDTEEEVDEVGAELMGVADEGHANMLVNMGRVELAKSMILATFRRLKDRLAEAGGQLRICGVDHQEVKNLFKLSGYDKILSIDADEIAALKRF